MFSIRIVYANPHTPTEYVDWWSDADEWAIGIWSRMSRVRTVDTVEVRHLDGSLLGSFSQGFVTEWNPNGTVVVPNDDTIDNDPT